MEHAQTAPSFESPEHRRILSAFLDPGIPDLCQVAAALETTVTKIAEWASNPATAEHLEKLASVFELRARMLLAQFMPSILDSMRLIAEKTSPEDGNASISERIRFRETARRAGSLLAKMFFQPLPEGRGRGVGSITSGRSKIAKSPNRQPDHTNPTPKTPDSSSTISPIPLRGSPWPSVFQLDPTNPPDPTLTPCTLPQATPSPPTDTPRSAS